MFCAYTRPRYHVSVYRTIDPLVSSSCSKHRPTICVSKPKKILYTPDKRVAEQLKHLAAVRNVAGSNPTPAKFENCYCSPTSEWVPNYHSGKFMRRAPPLHMP